MSIPTPFNPLGTPGAVELLDSVSIEGDASATSSLDFVSLAFGEPYYLEPFGSAGYSAEVEVSNVRGLNKDTGSNIVCIGTFDPSVKGVLMIYSFPESQGSATYRKKYAVRASKADGTWAQLLSQSDKAYEVFSVSHRISDGVYSGEGPARNINTSLGAWTSAESRTMRISICAVPGVSYDFKRLYARTANETFEALPARRGGGDGIAFFVDGKFKTFFGL